MAFETIEKRKKKKKRFANVAQVDEKYWGPEPDIETIDNPRSSELSHALSWYNYFYTIKDGRKWLELYLKQNQRMSDYSAVRKCPDNFISTTSCWIAKLMLNGTEFSDSCLVYFENKIKDYHSFNSSTHKPDTEETEPAVRTLSPADRVKKKNESILESIELEIDKAIESGFQSKFSLYEFLNAQGSNPMLLNILKPRLEKIVDELETYPEDFMGNGKVAYRRHLEFFETMLKDVLTLSRNKKVIRKTRAKKPLTTDKILKNLKYQEKYDPLKLVSIAPSQILGKQMLWIYNTRYNQLQLYTAEDPKGFTVKGTTLQNWSDKSYGKRLRKPHDMLQEFMSSGLVAQKKFLLTIKAKDSTLNGRIGKDSILLKAI